MKENESDWELDPEFEKRDALRKAGIPVEIARTDQLLIRETIDSDISELPPHCFCCLEKCGTMQALPLPTGSRRGLSTSCCAAW